MKPTPIIVVSAFLFSLIGLLAAWGVGICAPTPTSQLPTYERACFIVMPLGGAAVGWFIGYLATPLPGEK